MDGSSLDSEFREGVIHVVPEKAGIVAVSLEGDFDLANMPALADRFSEALEDGTGLIVDLDEATFIDSTVVQVLVQTARGAAERGKVVVLQLGTEAAVARTIEIVGIERIVPRARDRQGAVRMIERNREAEVDAAKLVALTYVNTNIFQGATTSIAEGLTWDFFCECGRPACDERIALTLEGYSKLRGAGGAILAPGHQVDAKVRARALRRDARALRAQAQHQFKRAKKNLDGCSRP